MGGKRSQATGDGRCIRGLVLCAFLAASGCAHGVDTAFVGSPVNAAGEPLSLVECDATRGRPAASGPANSVAVLVHGRGAGGDQFGALARALGAQGHRVLCFNYDYRERVAESARKLGAALDSLRMRAVAQQVTVVGHSQGGLVARLALAEDAASKTDPYLLPRVTLITVATPFAGVRLASVCGRPGLRVASLGTISMVCRMVTGANWREIHPNAELIRRPPPLSARVVKHVAIVTDERNSCRRWGVTGECERDDFVFSVEEQLGAAILSDPRVRVQQVGGGHVELLGAPGRCPHEVMSAMVSPAGDGDGRALASTTANQARDRATLGCG